MTEEMFDVVNEKNKLIGLVKSRNEVHKNSEWHRGVHIWIFNSKGEILCQKRSETKDLYPGYWDTLVGGHVEAGKNYDETPVKELNEKLSLNVSIDNLIPFGIKKYEMPFENMVERVFAKIYIYKYNGNLSKLKLQEDEVSQLEFIKIEDLRKFKNCKDNSRRFISFYFFDFVIPRIMEEISND